LWANCPGRAKHLKEGMYLGKVNELKTIMSDKKPIIAGHRCSFVDNVGGGG
jgi:hypothetical protein